MVSSPNFYSLMYTFNLFFNVNLEIPLFYRWPKHELIVLKTWLSQKSFMIAVNSGKVIIIITNMVMKRRTRRLMLAATTASPNRMNTRLRATYPGLFVSAWSF